MSLSLDLTELSVKERLQVLEQVWQSLLSEDAEIPSPRWHEAVLDRRIERLSSGDAKFISLEELKKEFQT